MAPQQLGGPDLRQPAAWSAREPLWRGAGTIVCWWVVGVLAILASVQLAGADDVNLLFVLTAGLTPLTYLPAWAVLVFAASRRQWALALVAAVLVAVQVTWVVGHVGRAPARAVAAGGTALRVLTANVNMHNTASAGLGRQIEVEHPDLVVLQEASPQSFTPILRTGVLTRYPYRSIDLDTGARGLVLLSRYPLEDAGVHTLLSARYLQAAVRAGGSTLHVVVVHTTSPLEDRNDWRRQLAALGRLGERLPTPALMLGDFNATPYNHGLASLISKAGLADAAGRRGQLWPMTWPAWSRWLPTVLQLDHVLVSRDVQVRSARTGDPSGSDHLPLLVDLDVPAAEGSP